MDAFLCTNDDLMERAQYCSVVSEKLCDDEQLKRQLINQFDKIDKDGTGVVNEHQVKQALLKILKKQINKLSDDNSESEDMIKGLQLYAEGSYAKDIIEQIITSFKEGTVVGDDETFLQMNDLLEIFYNDPDMNRELTKVRGNDFCEMLGLFFDLTDRIRAHLLEQLEGKDNLQEKYDTLFQESRAVKKPVGGPNKDIVAPSSQCESLTPSTTKSKVAGPAKKKKSTKTKKISVANVDEEPKYMALLEQN